jgi:hypothetical protein
MTPEVSGPEKKGMRSDQFSGLLLLALALYVGWQNRAYPIGSLQEPGPGYMPLLLAVFLGLMGLLIMAWGGKSTPLAAIPWPEAKRAMVIMLVCVVGSFALERLGYRITIIAMLIVFLGVLERRQPLKVLLVSVGFGFISFYVIGDLLDVPLPRSPWGF